MSKRKGSIATKLSLALAGCISALLVIVTFALSQYLTDKLEQKSFEALKANNRMITELIDGYNRTLEQTVQRLGRVFAGTYTQRFSYDAGSATLTYNGSQVSALDTSTPDRFTELSGANATVLVRKGSDFERTSTSVKNEKGERASGSTLGTDHPATSLLLKGEHYTGKAKMLGRDFMTHYIPLRDQGGNVIGAFFVGIDFTDGLAAMKKKILAMKIGETGYPYAMDLGKDKGMLTIHPAKEGTSLLGMADTRGKRFVDEMIEDRKSVV